MRSEINKILLMARKTWRIVSAVSSGELAFVVITKRARLSQVASIINHIARDSIFKWRGQLKCLFVINVWLLYECWRDGA